MGKRLGLAGLGLALLAVAPSYAAFTPAILGSLLALWLAAGAAAGKKFKLSLLTLLISTVTVFFISPITGLAFIADHAAVLWILIPTYLVYVAGAAVGLNKKQNARQ